jgi:hypothetical protein
VVVNASQALDHFRSTSVYDDLALAAVWLFRATSDRRYLDEAVDHLQVRGWGSSCHGRVHTRGTRPGKVLACFGTGSSSLLILPSSQAHLDREVTPRLMAQPSFYTANWDNSLWAVLAQLLSLGPQLPPQLAGGYRYLLHEFVRTWKNGKVPLVSATHPAV